MLKSLAVGVLVLPFLILTSGGHGTADGRDYILFAREVIDKPAKTQVLLRIIVPLNISKAELEALLTKVYQEQLGTTGFKYHRTPTHVAIYAFSNREYAAEEPGWVGMLLRMGEGQTPSIDVREELLVALRKPPETKFGLSEVERRRIWEEVVKSEDQAERQAEKRHPVPPIWTPGYDLKALAPILRKRDEMSDSLTLRYRAEILRKYRLTNEQWLEIRRAKIVEAVLVTTAYHGR